MGCVACIWTELIDNSNFWSSILPALYMIGLRFNEYPKMHKDLPIVLYKLCEKFGYPDDSDTFKRRIWKSFKNPLCVRSCANIKVGEPLNREHDIFPSFSKKLVKTQFILYSHCILKDTQIKEIDLDEILDFCCEATNDDLTFLKKLGKGWEEQALIIIKKSEKTTETYKNGIICILERLIRNRIKSYKK